MEYTTLSLWRDSNGTVLEAFRIEPDGTHRLIAKTFMIPLDAFLTWCEDKGFVVQDLEIKLDPRHRIVYGILSRSEDKARMLNAKWFKDEDVERATWLNLPPDHEQNQSWLE